MEELRAAYYRDIEKVKKRTILVLNESIQRFESDELIAELHDYHKRYPFIKMGSPGWKNRISYAMPIYRYLDNTNSNSEVRPGCEVGQDSDTELLIDGSDTHENEAVRTDDDCPIIVPL